MKYLITTALTILLAQTCLAMDFSREKEKRQFMNNIVLNNIEDIKFEAIPREWLNIGIYLASCSKRYDALQQLLANKADSKSIYAQLALVDARLRNDIVIPKILKETPTLTNQEALYYAVTCKQLPLIAQLLNVLALTPHACNCEIIQIAFIYAQYSDDYEEIMERIAEYIAPPSECDALQLISKYNLHNTLYDMFEKAQLSTLMILQALETAITHNASDSQKAFIEYIIGYKLHDEVICLACEHDLDKTIPVLLDLFQDRLNAANYALKLAKQHGSEDTIKAIQNYSRRNTLVAEHPRVIALRKSDIF